MAVTVSSSLTQQPSDRLRMEIDALIATGDDAVAGLKAEAERAYELIDGFMRQTTADESTGEFTQTGMLARRRVHAEPLVIEAARLRSEANREERVLGAQVDAYFAKLAAPIKDPLEFLTLQEGWRRFDKEDPVTIAITLRLAVQSDNGDSIMRIAMTYPAPPSGIADALQNWKPLISTALMKELRSIVVDRFAPMGSTYFRVSTLRQIAQHLEMFAGPDADPIAAAARG